MISTQELGALAGKSVVGPDDESIGKIKDVYESTDGGGGTFATVTTGLFGSGSSFFPLEAAELRGDQVAVPYSKSFIKDAPRVENDEELTAPEEERLFTYYQGGGTSTGASTGAATETVDRQGDAPGTVGHDTSGPTTDSAMTRSEERLNVGVQKQETGRAKLRKYIVTEQQQVPVTVSREEVRLEREPITDGNAGSALDGPALSEEEHEVILTEERPVVTTETVPVERVKLDKQTVSEETTVRGEVRKEQIDVEGDTDRR